MKNLMFFLLFLISLMCYSQAQQDYYLVVKQGESIEPIQKSVMPDGRLKLLFAQTELQSCFQSVSVYKYEKAFPNAVSEYLKRVYIVTLSHPDYTGTLLLLSNVEYVELIQEGEPTLEPNDLYYVGGEGLGKSYLSLVRANRAWDVTTGDPSVIVGIVDTKFEPNHEDFQGQFVDVIGSNTNSSSHGIQTSGFVSPKTNNEKGVSGIGFNTRMIGMVGISTQRAYELAQIPGVRVINASWYDGCYHSPIKQEIYNEIRNVHGVLMVAAAGNAHCGGPNNYVYPASYDNVLSVSSVGHLNPIGHSDMHNQMDVHQRVIYPSNPDLYTHNHNDKVDMVAPGFEFMITNENNTYTRITYGTSTSAPQVAAAAALVFSVKPDLTPTQVEDILKNTADDIYWIPYNQPYIGKLGTGRLNVFRAVKTAVCMDERNPVVDLSIRDSDDDTCSEPNNNTQYMWNSSDIFVRNQNDGKFVPIHQNPTYDGINPNYIYVRVTNVGCKTSSGNDHVKVNWAKANTSLQYPEFWDGSIIQNGVALGGVVGTGIIPPLAPGQDVLVEIPWYIPNPHDYYFINENPWHFCLLAEIISDDDPLSFPYTANPNYMVRNNNNLAWRNITVVDVANFEIGAAIAVTNPNNTPQAIQLEFITEDTETGRAIYEDAEVGVKMDNVLFAAWQRGGRETTKFENTSDAKKKIVIGNEATLSNLQLNANEIGTLYISFNFLTKKVGDKSKYRYHVIQRNVITGEIMGGETFDIHKSPRNLFVANAGDNLEIEKEEIVILTAEDIFEAATYNWYDENGSLIYTGREFEVSPEMTRKYKLEVVSEDGFKDYSEVEVAVNPYKLISISPIPVNSEVQINYDIQGSTSAYIIITDSANGISNNYILDIDTNSTQTIINMDTYQAGNYIVTLVCDGAIVNSKNLIKN